MEIVIDEKVVKAKAVFPSEEELENFKAEGIKKGLFPTAEERADFLKLEAEYAHREAASREVEKKVIVAKPIGVAMRLGGNLIDTARVGELRESTCEKHGTYSTTLLIVMKGKEKWRKCPQCKEEEGALKEREKAEKMALAKKNAIEQKFNRACVPARFQGKTIESFKVDVTQTAEIQYSQQCALLAAQTIAENFETYQENGLQLVFSGSVGTGKSHLATAIAQAIMQKQKTAFYITVMDLIRMVRDTWQRNSSKTESQIINQLVNVDLLVLDEIGVQYGSDSERITLFDVIDKRYREMKPTIYLTNLDKKAMKAFLGERSFDRIREGGMWVDFTWESYRSSSREAERK